MSLRDEPDYPRRSCRGMNPNTFLYDGNPEIAQLVTAMATCEGCVIQTPCRAFGQVESYHARNVGLAVVYGGVLFTRSGQAEIVRVAREMGVKVVVVRK